jgi:integrase
MAVTQIGAAQQRRPGARRGAAGESAMSTEVRLPTAQPSLRLFSPEAENSALETLRVPGELSPAMRLSEFFREWFLLVVLRKASASNMGLFGKSVDWWVELTGDPPLCEISELTLAEFAGRLEQTTYRRGRAGIDRRLSAKTIENHLTRIDRILTRAGPKLGKNRPGAKLLADPPAIAIDKVDTDTLPPFSWEQVQTVFAEIPHLARPSSLDITATDWWCGALSSFLYTGWRLTTVLSLDWSMVDMPDDAAWWIEAPASIVPKTKKASRRIVHGVLREALLRLRTPAASGLIFPHRHNVRTLHDWHHALQLRAGLPQPLGWNGWRRTFAMLMQTAGYQTAVDLGQAALDHSDAKITRDHYYDPVNDFIPRLPAVTLPSGGARQLCLF